MVSVTGNGTLNVLELGMTRVYAADVKNKAHFNHSEVSLAAEANNYSKLLTVPRKSSIFTHVLYSVMTLTYILIVCYIVE